MARRHSQSTPDSAGIGAICTAGQRRYQGPAQGQATGKLCTLGAFNCSGERLAG
jgi:hypothetical protein